MLGTLHWKMGVDSEVIGFNFGASRLLDVLKEYGLQHVLYTKIFCRKKDISIIKESCRKESDKGKASRKRLRAVRKGFGDKEKEREGVVYGPGICDKIVFFMFYFVLVFKTRYLTLLVIF